MKNTKIAKRYAKALFDLALEQNILNQVKSDMELVVSVCKQNNDFRLMLQSPIIYADKKEAILKEIFEKEVQQMSLFFLFLITRKKRESVIESIALQFVELFKEYKNITTALLSTAVDLDQNIKDKVVKLLKEQTKGEIELLDKVDKELIGGFVLNYKDKEYNASIKKQIEALKRNFEENLYIRGF